MTVLLEKRCTKCGAIKSADLFGKHCKNKDGLRSICKYCQSNQKREYILKNPITDQTNKMLAKAKQRAKEKNLPFDLDLSFIRSLVVTHCPVLGCALEWSLRHGSRQGGLDNSPSLDRIDPLKGYVKGNVWIISHKANRIKNNATHEELKLVTEAVGRAIVNSLDW